MQTVETATGFADQILWAAIRAPEAKSPMAARTIAGLVGLLAAEGADDVVAAILAPVPGGPATFEVVNGTPSIERDGIASTNGQHVLIDAPLTHLDVGRALREASRLANAGPGRVTVIAVGPDGLRRTALERDPAEPFRFVYPEAAAFRGLDSAVAEAVERWRLRLTAAPAVMAAETDSLTIDLVEPAPVAEPAPAPAVLDGEVLGEAVREALADVMVEVDMVAVEQMVSDALRSALAAVEARNSQAAAEPPTGWAGQAALVAAADQFHVVLESFNDRIRAGSRSLQSLADELAAQERVTALYTDQLAKSVHSSIERLTRHVDARFDELNRGSGLRRERQLREARDTREAREPHEPRD